MPIYSRKDKVMRLDSYTFSCSGGMVSNEDAVEKRNLSDGLLCVLADGGGEQTHGGTASRLVAETMRRSPYETGCDAARWLEERLLEANALICSGQKNFQCTMTSTAVALLLQGEQAYWSHIGDSRLYFLHGSSICAVTEDHTEAYEKYKAGQISRSQIVQEERSVLLRSLGRAECHPDNAASGRLETGDAFLLCSDGLWSYLRDEEILIDRLKSRTAGQWGELLLLRAAERLHSDSGNLSLITVMVQ
jgi:serine/threonine protein phosphatase PrpC